MRIIEPIHYVPETVCLGAYMYAYFFFPGEVPRFYRILNFIKSPKFSVTGLKCEGRDSGVWPPMHGPQTSNFGNTLQKVGPTPDLLNVYLHSNKMRK